MASEIRSHVSCTNTGSFIYRVGVMVLLATFNNGQFSLKNGPTDVPLCFSRTRNMGKKEKKLWGSAFDASLVNLATSGAGLGHAWCWPWPHLGLVLATPGAGLVAILPQGEESIYHLMESDKELRRAFPL